MSVADKLSLIAENQTKVFEAGYEKGKSENNYEEAYEAGQKSMYDESKIIEKTISAMRKLELTDVSEIIHTVHCKVEEYIEPIEEPLFDINKYTTVGGKIAFDISKLKENQIYVLKSDLPLKQIKISNSSSGYASFIVQNNTSTEVYFTMSRHSNIAVGTTQYLFLTPSTSYISDIASLDGYNIRIELVRADITDTVLNINGVEYPMDETGEISIKSDGPYMTFFIIGSWKLTVNYHKSIGSQSAYDVFWDSFQNNGALASYQYTFCGGAWNDKTFYPKYDIKLGLGYSGTNAFWSCAVSNIAERLEELGLVLDTTLCGYWSSMFQNVKSTRLPELNCTHAMDYSTSSFQNVFLNSTIETIDKMIVPENLLYKNNTFQGCSNLKNIIFEGVIAETINFQWSPLTVDSMKSIISCLKDFSGTTNANTKTITFSEACWAELEASGSSPAGGTWEDYVTSLGWNV